MKKPPIPTSDPHVIAILHRAGRIWRGIMATTRSGQVTILETKDFTSDRIQRLDGWLDAHKASGVLCVLPGSAIICRNCPLPDAPAEQLEQALHLQSEAHLSAIAPPHRLGRAVLPQAPGETTRTGLVIAWPESAAFAPPLTTRPVTFVPDVAALAAILNGQRPNEPLLLLDREDGSVAVAITHPGGAIFRATHEEPSPAEAWKRSIGRIVAETSMSVGHSGQFIEAIVHDGQCKAASLQPGEAKLFLPQEMIHVAMARLQGASADPQWWASYGVAVGALLARTGPMEAMTRLQVAPPVETPSAIGAAVQKLSQPRTARALLVAAVLVLMFGPVVFSGLRLAILKVRYSDVQEKLVAATASRHHLAIYQELERQKAWPMTKLLADIAVCTPIGIEVENIRVEAGKDFAISGTAIANEGRTPAQLVALMQENLSREGMFGEIVVNAGKTDNLGRFMFDLSAKPAKPYHSMKLPPELDFGKLTYAARLYGEAADDRSSMTAAPAVHASHSTPISTPSSMPNISGASGEGEFQPDPVRSTASARPDLGRGTPTFDNPLDRGGGAGTVDPRAVPPPITEEQIRVMSRPELRDALHKIGQARSNRDLAPEDQARLKQEWDMIMEQLRKGGN